jgi:Protein of unknown function (DUF2000)
MQEQAETKKVVVAVNKKLEPGRALNAAAHALLGLSSEGESDRGRFQIVDYETSGESGFLASKLPLIVLRGSGGHLRRLRAELLEAGLPAVGFHSAMTEGSWEEQVQRSAAQPLDQLELYAIASIGERQLVDPLTKRLSLY